MPGKLDIDVTFELQSGTKDDFVMTLKVPATSLCPCSKEISQYGAHNQRCEMTVKVRIADGVNFWIEELFGMIEQCASTQVFSVLKRPDEKWVTERAYENPKLLRTLYVTWRSHCVMTTELFGSNATPKTSNRFTATTHLRWLNMIKDLMPSVQ